MRKQKPALEWRFIESDDAWERQQAVLVTEAALASERRRRLQRLLGELALLLFFLIGFMGWWRYSRQSALHKIEAEVRATAQAFNQTGEMDRAQIVNTTAARPQTLPLPPGENSAVTVQHVEILGEQAVVSLIIAQPTGRAALRRRQFYRHTPTGWQPTAPTIALWGAEATLATPYFVFHFREQDTTTVHAVAPQLDALYLIVQRNFGLPPITKADKLSVDVSILEPPGQMTSWLEATTHFTVASPLLYVAPVELTDAELLAQSLALPLVAHLLRQTAAVHAVTPAWLPLLDGIYLWQLWALDLPLSNPRTAVVKWLYLGLPASPPGRSVVLPPNYSELCALHQLWVASPLHIRIPLLCGERQWEERYLALWSSSTPPSHLAQIALPLAERGDEGPRASHPGQTVALALLIEYAVTTYGKEQLPILLAGLGRYERWATLLPAVYGVSPAEFEAGWQAYLAAHYGIRHIQQIKYPTRRGIRSPVP
ncbi:MAG: hypothetical protein R3E79_31000 [Caldilineaceae bacterium]